MSYQQALDFTLRAEGGYSDTPGDRGGATNHGVIQTTYDLYRAAKHIAPRPVSEITGPEVSDLYYTLYWLPAHCPQMSPALGVSVFDWAVNHGVRGALETLQEALCVPVDGVWGPRTQTALADLDHGELWRELNQFRREWYSDFAAREPTQRQFLRGWLARVDRLDVYCEALEKC